MLDQILFPNGDTVPPIPAKFQTAFPHIITDPGIHAGWPHIKGTRILAIDIFRAQVKGYSFNKMLMDFKEMGITVSEIELKEAFKFILEWWIYIDGKESAKTSR